MVPPFQSKLNGSILQVKHLDLREKVFERFGNNFVLIVVAHILIVVVADFLLLGVDSRHLIEILQRHIYSSTWGVLSGSCSRPDIECNRCQLKTWFGSE